MEQLLQQFTSLLLEWKNTQSNCYDGCKMYVGKTEFGSKKAKLFVNRMAKQLPQFLSSTADNPSVQEFALMLDHIVQSVNNEIQMNMVEFVSEGCSPLEAVTKKKESVYFWLKESLINSEDLMRYSTKKIEIEVLEGKSVNQSISIPPTDAKEKYLIMPEQLLTLKGNLDNVFVYCFDSKVDFYINQPPATDRVVLDDKIGADLVLTESRELFSVEKQRVYRLYFIRGNVRNGKFIARGLYASRATIVLIDTNYF